MPFLAHVHADTAREVNLGDNEPERQVWFNYWETELTFEKSYLARLHYVHQNPVKHGLVAVASQYPWCSAAWFERTARPAQVKTIYSFKTDRLRIASNPFFIYSQNLLIASTVRSTSSRPPSGPISVLAGTAP